MAGAGRGALGAATVALLLSACGGESTTEPGPPPPAPPTFPDLLSDVGVDDPAARLFEPQWKLWTNGTVKERKILRTAGGMIRTQDRERWEFPDGTRFTKTFSYFTESSPDTPVPVETRIILRKDGAWETAAYQWRADLSDAELLPGDQRVAVPVTLADGTSFEHLIPSRGDCQVCHVPNPAFILGFSEVQLNWAREGQGVTQLEAFGQEGFFDRPIPNDPEDIEAPDDRTRDVLGYVHANCAHCHNASSSAGGLDLSHPRFLENTVGRMASNGRTLIVPGDAEDSYLFEVFSIGRMPLLGVQLLDEAGQDLLRDWIENHDFDG